MHTRKHISISFNYNDTIKRFFFLQYFYTFSIHVFPVQKIITSTTFSPSSLEKIPRARYWICVSILKKVGTICLLSVLGGFFKKIVFFFYKLSRGIGNYAWALTAFGVCGARPYTMDVLTQNNNCQCKYVPTYFIIIIICSFVFYRIFGGREIN